MPDLCKLAEHSIGVSRNDADEVVVNAYDTLRAFQVPGSDSNNCSATLAALTKAHGLEFGRASFKSPGAKKATWAPACNMLQMIDLIFVLPGVLAATVRKTAAVVFASWLGAPHKVIQAMRSKHKITTPLNALKRCCSRNCEWRPVQ